MIIALRLFTDYSFVIICIHSLGLCIRLYALMYAVNERERALRVLYHRLYIILCKFSSLSAHVAANSFAHWLTVTLWSPVCPNEHDLLARHVLVAFKIERFYGWKHSTQLSSYSRKLIVHRRTSIDAIFIYFSLILRSNYKCILLLRR